MRRREFFSVIGGAAIAALAIVLLPVAAYAQSNPSLTTSRDQRSGYRSLRTVKPRYVDDASYKMKNKSYEDALKSIPDSKIELDPWKDAR
jgi:hypothetical protein